MQRAEVLRIDLELDDELVEAWLVCMDRYPALHFSEIVRALLIAEAEPKSSPGDNYPGG